MARSSIEKLDPEVRERLEDWLREFRDGRLQLDDVMTRLDAQFADQGVELPSRSAVHRHSQKVQALAERVQRSKDFADQLVAQVGPDLADGKGLQVLLHGFQSLAFDMMANLEPEQTLDPENLMFFSRAIQSMVSARKTDADLHLKIKAELNKEAAHKLEKAVTTGDLEREAMLRAKRIMGFD